MIAWDRGGMQKGDGSFQKGGLFLGFWRKWIWEKDFRSIYTVVLLCTPTNRTVISAAGFWLLQSMQNNKT